MTLIEQLNAVIIAIAEDISKNSGNSGSSDNSGSASSDFSDISVLLPQKIGASQKWYQSGLRHGAEYPYPYFTSTGSCANGTQDFIPFTALEDATITSLEIHCTTAQANSTISLGIYASDSNNDVADPLFTSSPISCNTTGAKNAPCNVQIKKGKVYWLSSLSISVSNTASFYRTNTNTLFSIKGSISTTTMTPIGYTTDNNTSMAQSAPTNKAPSTYAPRVLFITG